MPCANSDRSGLENGILCSIGNTSKNPPVMVGCPLDTPEKKEPQLKNHYPQIGLWVGLWGDLDLIANWCRRTQPNVSDTFLRQVVLVYGRMVAKKAFPCGLCFNAPALNSFPGFP